MPGFVPQSEGAELSENSCKIISLSTTSLLTDNVTKKFHFAWLIKEKNPHPCYKKRTSAFQAPLPALVGGLVECRRKQHFGNCSATDFPTATALSQWLFHPFHSFCNYQTLRLVLRWQFNYIRKYSSLRPRDGNWKRTFRRDRPGVHGIDFKLI